MAGERKSNEEIRLEIQRANDAKLLQNPAFQSFCLRLLRTAGILEPNQRADPVRSALAEGRRALGIEVLQTLLKADERAFELICPTSAVRESLIGKTAEPQPQEEAHDGPEYPFER